MGHPFLWLVEKQQVLRLRATRFAQDDIGLVKIRSFPPFAAMKLRQRMGHPWVCSARKRPQVLRFTQDDKSKTKAGPFGKLRAGSLRKLRGMDEARLVTRRYFLKICLLEKSERFYFVRLPDIEEFVIARCGYVYLLLTRGSA
jgi:hypothetical protein